MIPNLTVCCRDFVRTFLPEPDWDKWLSIAEMPERCYEDLKDKYPPEQWRYLHMGSTHITDKVDFYPMKPK